VVSKDLAARKVTVNVASSLVTEAVFTNARPSTPVRGCVWSVKFCRQHRDVTGHLVPNGGLGVGSDRLTAAQVHWALEAGQHRNFRFKLQSELIATLLNPGDRLAGNREVQEPRLQGPSAA
jgi:hypothetical protein